MHVSMAWDVFFLNSDMKTVFQLLYTDLSFTSFDSQKWSICDFSSWFQCIFFQRVDENNETRQQEFAVFT